MPPVAAVLAFVDCINRGDLDGLAVLMAEDHRLVVLDEEPLLGRAANVEAWRGYFTSYPDYVIIPRDVVADGGRVAILGVTTGSHLELPDDEEMKLTVIWTADVTDGRLTAWRIVDDTPANRTRLGFTSP